jgi:flagellar P-ring protein precursor FlgI
MNTRCSLAALAMALAAVPAAVAPPACAATVGDITRVEGQRINKLNGLGLVVGLNKTGDGGDFLPVIRPLAALLQRMNDAVISPLELKDAKNVALVTVTATIPQGGARKGDRLDVQVQSIGGAKSLKGGRLYLAPLQGPQRNSIVYALAEGPQVPTSGVVDGGAVLEEEITTTFVENNVFRLVLGEASSGFSMAATVATVINQNTEYEVGYSIARALDSRTVEVTVPEAYRANPVPFVGRVQQLDLILPRREARVEINERTGTVVITGNVEISPAVVSHNSLVVSLVASPQQPTTQPTVIQEGPFFGIDPQGEGGARLQDLVSALNVLKVPPADRIAIIKLLAKSGQIHAEVTFVE